VKRGEERGREGKRGEERGREGKNSNAVPITIPTAIVRNNSVPPSSLHSKISR